MTGPKKPRPKKVSASTPRDPLRARAEEALRQNPAPGPTPAAKLTAAQARALLHDLQVHQVELELQNEELRRSEASLLESRQRYFDLYNLAPVGYCTVDDAGRITEANLTLATLLGHERRALLHEPFARYLDPTEADVLHLTRQRLFANGGAQRLEVRLVRRDGTPLWGLVELTLAPATGAPHTCRITVNDITARRRVEESLRERELRYRTFSDTAPDAIITTESRGRILDANPAAVRMFGLGLLELGGRPVEQLLPQLFAKTAGEAESRDFAARAAPLLGGAIETVGRREGGAEFPAEISLARWVAGGAPHFTLLIRDTTERWEAQKQVRKLSRIVEQAPFAVVITNLAGVIEYVNPHFTVQSGYTADEVVGQNVRILKSGETKPEVYAELWATITAGGIWRGEFVNRSKKGERLIERATIIPVVDVAGRPTVYVGIKEDVTRRRQEQAERQALALALEEARRLEGVGLMTSGVAHEFNNILAGIIGQLELMRLKLPVDSPTVHQIKRVDESCWRAAALCQQLLMCAGIGRTAFGTNDLNQVVSAVLEGLPTVPAGVKIETQLAAPPPIVRGDTALLKQVVNAIVSNAVEAIDGAGGTVEVATGVADLDAKQVLKLHLSTPVPAGRYVFVDVADTGCGMDSETLSQIFTPFFSTKMRGRGLGLAAVLGIMKSHGGSLRVRSKPGGPTQFILYFPLGEVAPQTSVATPS